MSGNETKKYIIKYHPALPDGGGYGVHLKASGQVIGAYPTMELAERAMMLFVAADRRRALADGRAKSAFVRGTK